MVCAVTSLNPRSNPGKQVLPSLSTGEEKEAQSLRASEPLALRSSQMSMTPEGLCLVCFLSY